MLRGIAPFKAPQLLGASAATGMSVTGTTDETALATVVIPAGAMGLNGGLHIYATWSMTNNANNKTPRIRLGGIGGTVYAGLAQASIVTVHAFHRIRNRGAANSQVGGTAAATNNVFSTTTGTPVTSSVNTAVEQTLVFSGQLATGTDTLTLETYEVWLMPG